MRQGRSLKRREFREWVWRGGAEVAAEPQAETSALPKLRLLWILDSSYIGNGINTDYVGL